MLLASLWKHLYTDTPAVLQHAYKQDPGITLLMAQASYIIQVSPLPGKWDKITHKGNISQIQIQQSNNSNNVVIYATGDAQFVSDMASQNKPLIEASNGQQIL